jgi:hypothetical protein
MSLEGYTHICGVPNCGHFYTLGKHPNKEYWANNSVLNHLKKAHGDGPGAFFIKAELDAQVCFF